MIRGVPRGCGKLVGWGKSAASPRIVPQYHHIIMVLYCQVINLYHIVYMLFSQKPYVLHLGWDRFGGLKRPGSKLSGRSLLRWAIKPNRFSQSANSLFIARRLRF